jgi:hypothetical protein
MVHPLSKSFFVKTVSTLVFYIHLLNFPFSKYCSRIMLCSEVLQVVLKQISSICYDFLIKLDSNKTYNGTPPLKKIFCCFVKSFFNKGLRLAQHDTNTLSKSTRASSCISFIGITKFCWSWEGGPVHREVCYDPFLPDQIFQKYALYIYIYIYIYNFVKYA